MLNGGEIIDVVSADEAKIAEDAGRSPSRRSSGCPRTSDATAGVARMSTRR
jgi:pyridoxal biosynthesis lyase PdxS